MAQRQINIRLPDDEVSVLEAAAFLQNESLAELVRATIMDRVSALRGDQRVLELLRLRAEQSAENDGVLRPLDAKRRDARNGEPA